MIGVYFSGTGNSRYVLERFLKDFEAKILRDFVKENSTLWRNKKVFIIATMGLFSGDGAGILGRLLKKYGAEIMGGLHVMMPDSIADEKVLKNSQDDNILLVRNAERKIEKAVIALKAGNPAKEGIGLFYHVAGLFGQRLYFGHKTKHYRKHINIDTQKCVGCRADCDREVLVGGFHDREKCKNR